MIVICYHRVSTVDQNPRLARRELDQAARARFPRLQVRHVAETGSGRRNDRPGLVEVLRQVDRGEVAAVLVWKLDRFGRSPMDLDANIARVRRGGARFVAVTQGIDVSAEPDAVGDLVVRVLSAVAAFERDLISERTRLAYRNRRRAWGRPPSMPAADQVRARELARAGASVADLVARFEGRYTRQAIGRVLKARPKRGVDVGRAKPRVSQQRRRADRRVRK